MKEIGAKLRAARETKKISLEEIQAQTKIRRRFLEAIESGDWDVIPGEIYLRGFICSYAELVGLDGAELLREYRESRQQFRLEETGNQDHTSDGTVKKPINTQSTTIIADRSPQPKIGRLSLLIIVILILIGLFGVYLLTGGLKTDRTTATKVKTTVNSRPMPTSVHKITKPRLTEVNAVSKPPAATIVPQFDRAPLSVSAEFSETVWVQVTTDGQVKYSGSGATFTAKSPKQIWTAQQKMVMRIGNVAGIRLTFNGKVVELKGKQHQPRTIILTANGVEIH
jgi:cytoskeletal protein RodZ